MTRPGDPADTDRRCGTGKIDAMAVAVFLAIGLVAGWLASLLVGGGGLLRYIIIGVIGCIRRRLPAERARREARHRQSRC